MNYMEQAFAPAEAHYKNLMNIQTWGHLFPEGDTRPYYTRDGEPLSSFHLIPDHGAASQILPDG